MNTAVYSFNDIPDYLVASLSSRDAALWVTGVPSDTGDTELLAQLVQLPWKQVLLNRSTSALAKLLSAPAELDDVLVRRRGFVQLVSTNPALQQLPHRCLPIYLLDGGPDSPPVSPFEQKLASMSMLETLRRASVRELVVVSIEGEAIPAGLTDLWQAGFRARLVFASKTNAQQPLSDWAGQEAGPKHLHLSTQPPTDFIGGLLSRYNTVYPDDRLLVRIRRPNGDYGTVDLSDIDDPERPLLELYDLIQERDLAPVLSDELSEDEVVGFFSNPNEGWRPYAAGLPWLRDGSWMANLGQRLQTLDATGASENVVAYIVSEDGAGATTLSRTLAWEFARQGYPTLLAKPAAFIPDSLTTVNFLTRAAEVVHSAIDESSKESAVPGVEGQRRHQTPWLIVFDRVHWDGRDGELRRFVNQLSKSGRPACVLAVSGPVRGLAFWDSKLFKQIGELGHEITSEEAESLGRHLNRFLEPHGLMKSAAQWRSFYEEHTVRYLEGVAAFWVALSFWLQGHYDLSETLQQWIYRTFRGFGLEEGLERALLRIAALSSCRIPLPESLLPNAGDWPASALLTDKMSSLAALGLVKFEADGIRYWALIHDILGRQLLNGVFFDSEFRSTLGLEDARDPVHLRFQILGRIATDPRLGEQEFHALGEEFSTTVFKVDPDHGHQEFATMWREVLEVLDTMPSALRDTSRVFRHHTAVSRRRIAKLGEDFYGVTSRDKRELLRKAVADLRYALEFIPFRPGSEPNLNLYNSLANAYLDLADVEEASSADTNELVQELRVKASESIRRAYLENPTNQFVIETLSKDLLSTAKSNPAAAVENCTQVLGIVFSALASGESRYRRTQLGDLADEALRVLFKTVPPKQRKLEIKTSVDVLTRAWFTLTEGGYRAGMDLADLGEVSRKRALEVLGHPAGRGNMQVLRLRYELTALQQPLAYEEQLALLEELANTDYRVAPQLQLERAILLYQVGRAFEGDRAFRSLRRLWRESEHFVDVPERLRWLRETTNRRRLKKVFAVVGSESNHRTAARVQQFGNSFVFFRLEEFGFRGTRPGQKFTAHVSFGHNGPFLRPVTARPSRNP